MLWELCGGLYVGGVDVQGPAVGPIGVPEVHGLLADVQDVPPEVLDFWVLHQIKLTDGHPDGKACVISRSIIILYCKTTL